MSISLEVKIISQENLANVIDQIPLGMSRAALFGGDRYSCVDEGVALVDQEVLIGLATIAPEGEQLTGIPTIVGLWIKPQYRMQGNGKLLMKATVERCIERGFETVLVDGLVAPISKIVDSLPENLKQHVDYRNFGMGLPVLPD